MSRNPYERLPQIFEEQSQKSIEEQKISGAIKIYVFLKAHSHHYAIIIDDLKSKNLYSGEDLSIGYNLGLMQSGTKEEFVDFNQLISRPISYIVGYFQGVIDNKKTQQTRMMVSRECVLDKASLTTTPGTFFRQPFISHSERYPTVQTSHNAHSATSPEFLNPSFRRAPSDTMFTTSVTARASFVSQTSLISANQDSEAKEIDEILSWLLETDSELDASTASNEQQQGSSFQY